ncbi:hypothetical protein HNR06_000524 [Nocardiopsis arvandica]|uniref:Interferon-induced transmembrane protein n=1 Tax=Nocardiopsis sinuspersici TaxID=501010 RepID=A0A7Y9XA11_9ACTN|nr:CD225/dispanin family protein [Nocardiopsis sinuspersici]NYH50935.1 hypothetical protein [Nocardiopsis sinuspersici]
MSYGPPPPGNPGGPPPGGGYGPPGGYGAPGGGYGGGYGAQPPAGEPPKNYLVHNILGIITCIPLIGIIGVVFAAQVKNKWSVGDYAGAQSAATTAKILGIIGLVLFGFTILYVIFMVIGIAAGIGSEM